MALLDALSVIFIVLSNLLIPIVRASILASRMPVLVMVWVALVGMIVVIGLGRHELTP